MSMETDAQYRRLCEMYAEKSDDELLDMDEHSEDLTEIAQQALAQVMKERGLERGAQVVAEPAEDKQPDPADSLALVPGEVVVANFDDAFRANEAIRLVTEAGISCRMVDMNMVRPRRTMDGAYLINLGMVVVEADKAKVVKLLETGLGFPPAEEADRDAADEHLAELAMVSMFSRQDGLVAAQALGAAGISYVWRDGKEERVDLPDEDTVVIEVGEARLQEAMRVVEEKLGSLD